MSLDLTPTDLHLRDRVAVTLQGRRQVAEVVAYFGRPQAPTLIVKDSAGELHRVPRPAARQVAS